MLTLRYAALLVALGTIVMGASALHGQEYPNKPIRIVTPGGGAGDVLSRLIGSGISEALGQSVIVDNRATIIAIETVAKATPDGYTLLAYGNSLWIGPLLQKLSYDAVRDFAPIALAVSAPNLLVAHPSLPAKSVKDLVALAKARSGELNYSGGSSGSSDHLAAELFKSLAHVDMTRISYKAQGPALNALVAGEVQLMFPTASSAMPFVKAGRLTALGVSSGQPSALIPGVPTIASSLPGYESGSLIGILAPAKSPSAIVNQLNREIVRVLNKPDIKDKLFNLGSEVVASSPEQFDTKLKSEIAIWGKVIKDAGIRAE